MCTLIVGLQIFGPDTLVVGANRDEDPARPTDPPGVLVERPRVVGGRDRIAGGTWLAVRESRAVVAMLNRRPPPGWAASPTRPGRRSRGLLAIDLATVGGTSPTLTAAALAQAEAAVRDADYDPFSTAFLTPAGGWVMSHEPGSTVHVELSPGWHVLTHADLDDDSEPRTAWLRRELSGLTARPATEVVPRLRSLLAAHGEAGRPAVCIHEGRMLTVSSSIVVLAPGGNRYLHVEGRPCEREPSDVTELLDPMAAPRGRDH